MYIFPLARSGFTPAGANLYSKLDEEIGTSGMFFLIQSENTISNPCSFNLSLNKK